VIFQLLPTQYYCLPSLPPAGSRSRQKWKITGVPVVLPSGDVSYAVHKAVSKVLASHAAEGQSICVEVATPNHG